MVKVYDRIVWENYPSEETPLNETNLNRMDYAIDVIDDRIVNYDTTKANQSDLLQSLKNITYNDSTGIFTFTWWNGSTRQVDLNVEKIPVSFSMSPQGILTMTTADGTKFTADIAEIIKLYTFNDSTDIHFNTVTDANGNKTITAFIVDGSVTESKLQPNFLADCRGQVAAAELQAQNSEAWAKGTRDGVGVPTTDETYHNNSSYYATRSSDYANESKDFSQDSEAWARGSRDGTDVASSDETYENNSKYYSELSGAYKDLAYSYIELVQEKGEEAVEAIENAFDIDAPQFVVDLATGHLLYEGGRFLFQVNETNGHLEWGMAV